MDKAGIILRKIFKRYLNTRNIFFFFIPVSIGVLLTMVLNLSKTVEALSNSLIERTSERTEIELDRFSGPIRSSLNTAGEWINGNLIGLGDPDYLNSQFMPVLSNFPQISSMLIADTGGNEYMLLRKDSTWINRVTINQDGEQTIFKYFWDYHSGLDVKLISRENDTINYDPRLRPWFQQLSDETTDGFQKWTDPYIFYTTKEPGITLSMKTKNRNGDPVIVAFDVLLTDLSLFTTALDVSPNGFTLVMTDDHHVLGLPGREKFLHVDSIKEYVLSKAETLGIPVLDFAVDSWKKKKGTTTVFEIKTKEGNWWAGFNPIPIGGQQKLFSVVLVPEQDFMAEMNRTRFVVISGFLLVICLTILVIRGYNQKQKANVLLARQKMEIQRQKEEIEHKNKEITDSIIYARRIQSAILPNKKKTDDILDKYFIYYKPKEIVSGDFYWIERRANKVMFAAVDCTGHGVPGALMSIIGYDGLNRAIREYEITKSDKILNALNDSVTETLRQTGSVDVSDGMDIALCVLNFDTSILEFSGAKNPAYIIRSEDRLLINGSEMQPKLSVGDFHLFEIKPDRMGIEPTFDLKRFTPNRISMKKGDRIYIFTDGFADQFGGEQGKKYSYSRFRELLLGIQDLNFNEQKNQLELEFEKWQGKLEQVDDILILGVEV